MYAWWRIDLEREIEREGERELWVGLKEKREWRRGLEFEGREVGNVEGIMAS